MHSLKTVVGLVLLILVGCTDRQKSSSQKVIAELNPVSIKSGEELQRTFERLTGVNSNDSLIARWMETLPSGNEIGSFSPIHYRTVQKLAAHYCFEAVSASFSNVGSSLSPTTLPLRLWAGLDLNKKLSLILGPTNRSNRQALAETLLNEFMGPSDLEDLPQRQLLVEESLKLIEELYLLYCPSTTVCEDGSSKKLAGALCTGILGSLSVARL